MLGDADENGFLYTIAPVITAGLTGSVSKTYDATDEASLGAANYTVLGEIDDDVVTLNNPAAGFYDDKNVGMGKTVTVDGIVIVSATNGAARVFGYQLASTGASNTNGEIEQAPVSIAGMTAEDKVYNGVLNAILGAFGAPDRIFPGDDLGVDTAGVTALFADRNVGTGIVVTATGYVLIGADAGNYRLVGDPTTTAAITPAIVTVDLIGSVAKQYDATVGAPLTDSNYQPTGFVPGDNIGLNNPAAGTYGDKNVGTDKLVTVTGLALSGSDAGNYQLASTSASAAIGAISPAPLTIEGLDVKDKDYDGTTPTDVSGGMLVGGRPGDNVNFDATGASASFADKNAGTGKAVTVSGFVLTGDDAGNYFLVLPTDLTADIRRAVVTVAGVTAEDRVYNAATDATLGGTWALVEIVDGDDATLDSGASIIAFFADKNVGTDKAVTISGFALTGADAGNYELIQPTGVTASITPAMVTIGGSFTAQDKTYDGALLALINTSGLTLTGVRPGDNAGLDTAGATGSFADKNVGTGKTVSLNVSGALTGDDAMNYILAPGAPTATASITPATVTVEVIGLVLKQYDAAVAAPLTAANLRPTGFVDGDNIGLNNPVATYDDKNVGMGKLVTVTGLALTGADAGNYQLVSTSASAPVGQITQAILIVELAGPVFKTYDAGVVAALTASHYRVSGIRGVDILQLTNFASGTYSDKNVGTGKLVTVTGLGLAGPDAGNYQLESTEVSAEVGEIEAAELSLMGAFRTLNKQYDGTRDASADLGGLSPSGVLGDDIVGIRNNGATASFADKNVGTGKIVTLDTADLLTGEDAGNYVLTGDAPTAMADITPATLTVVVDDAEREENEPNPPFTFSISGFVSGEDESLVSGVAATTSATAASPPGEYAITASGGVADNYRFVYRDGVLNVAPAAATAPIASSDPVNDQVFRASSAIQDDAGGMGEVAAAGAGRLSLTEGPLFDAMTGATFASVVNAGEAGAFTSRVGGDEAGAEAFENRSRNGAASAPGGERAYWTGAETDEEEFAYRRIQPKINVNVRFTQRVIYVGYPE